MPVRYLPVLLSALMGAALPMPAQASEIGSNFYCCIDPSSERRVCGDLLPTVCRGRAYRVLDRAGNVVKEVAPAMTPEQKKAWRQEQKRRALEESNLRLQRRRDQALLDTYATPEDIDLAQLKAEDDANFTISAARRRIAEANKLRQALDQEAEFYVKKTMPDKLNKDIQAVEHKVKVENELIAVKEKELDAIRERYHADRKRYYELTGRRSEINLDAGATAQAPEQTPAPTTDKP